MVPTCCYRVNISKQDIKMEHSYPEPRLAPRWQNNQVKAHLNILREVESLCGPAEVGRDGDLQVPGRPVLGAGGG